MMSKIYNSLDHECRRYSKK